jgi:non-haem Fe2+, alpha-ketoglutarate-dependent halogenase
MQKMLSKDEVAGYRDRGYHFPIDALSPGEVADFRRKLEDYEAESGSAIKADMRHRSHVLFTWIDEMVRHPKILDAMEDLLGPDILCWNTSFFIKEAHDPGFVSWHQDATYWGLSSSDVATAWIAMSPANKVSGCMKFIAGTHRQQVQHADTFDKNNLLTRGQEIAVDVDDPLYPDPPEAGGRPARLGDTGTRQGYLSPLSTRPCAEARPRAGGASLSQGSLGRTGESALSRHRQDRVPGVR